jgi:uncharacterized protein YbbC (DUF1343 family)
LDSTIAPFQLIGAPWIDGRKLAKYLAPRNIPGVRFAPTQFLPTAGAFEGRSCSGIRVLLVDRKSFDAGRLGVELESALYHLYPQVFAIDRTVSLVGSQSVVQAIKAGADPVTIVRSWNPQIESFLSLGDRYLLYPTPGSAGQGTL